MPSIELTADVVGIVLTAFAVLAAVIRLDATVRHLTRAVASLEESASRMDRHAAASQQKLADIHDRVGKLESVVYRKTWNGSYQVK